MLWMFAGLIAGLLASLILFALGLITRAAQLPVQSVTPILTVLPLPADTVTPTVAILPTEAPLTPTTTPVPAQSAEIAQGQLVEVFGTGGDGLRFRLQAGLDARIAFLGVESEVFEVQGGPEEADSYQWWFLRNPYNPEKAGWAVATYLRPISAP
jgi:hypothetical protein